MLELFRLLQPSATTREGVTMEIPKTTQAEPVVPCLGSFQRASRSQARTRSLRFRRGAVSTCLSR
eukprot:scaffold2284_cov402-Prasinococcus_capsulatus_cf.AAC.13